MEITNQDIDKAIEHFENRQFSDTSEKEFIGQFPEVLSYLTSNQFSILSEDEYMVLLFDSMVLLKSIIDKTGSITRVDNNTIELMETKNWDKFESLDKMSFEDKADKLFNDDHEDVVDFILSGFENEEDDDDDNIEISIPAKEIILISLKTIFDCYTVTV